MNSPLANKGGNMATGDKGDRADGSVKPWQNIGVDERLMFMDAVHSALTTRQLYGHATYGDVFQGDPLQHAWEELLDGLFYVWVARRARNV